MGFIIPGFKTIFIVIFLKLLTVLTINAPQNVYPVPKTSGNVWEKKKKLTANIIPVPIMIKASRIWIACEERKGYMRSQVPKSLNLPSQVPWVSR